MRPSVALLALGTCALILGLMLMPITGCGCGGPETACLSNVKQQAIGLIQYADDHDDRYPWRDAWMDGIRPYVRSEPVFHDPEGPKGGYGYAFNAALSGAKEPDGTLAVKTPMVYDSVDPIRNASDLVTSLPHPGRHKGRNTIAYADGHAKLVKVP